jgi:RNA polymerase sigma-70 factor (ECF subfamily)
MTGAASDGGPAAELERDAAALTADLLRFARSLTNDAALAEDLVQETFVRAIASIGQHRGESSLRTWMHRILHHLAIDRARRSARELVVDEVEERWRDDGYTVDPEVLAGAATERDEIEEALVRLPFHYRSAVVLHDMVGWTVAEIAEHLDIGLPAAKQRLRRGRMMFTTSLAEGAERRRDLEGVPMRCWDARQMVSDYLDDDLPAEQRRLVEAHLETCPTCPPLYASLVHATDALASIAARRDRDDVVPPHVAERIAATLR